MMGWLSKVFGIDSKRKRQAELLIAQKKAADAAARAAEVAEQTRVQTAEYNKSMVEIQQGSLRQAQDSAKMEQTRIDEARQRAAKQDEADAARAAAEGTLAANNRVDLRADTVANVVAGGTAEQVAAEVVKRKKSITSTNPVSTQLGINI